MNADEKILKVRGGELFMRRAGNGPTVLFLHGAGGVPGWLPFFDKLSDRFDLLVPDHPSFGNSPPPDWLDDMGDLAYFYLDLFEELGLKDIHIVGHSMGGWLSQEIAIRSQARIKSITLMSSVGIPVKNDPVADLFMMAPEQLLRALYADPDILARELARTPAPEEIQRMIVSRRSSARLAWSPRFVNLKLSKWLHRITVPVQLVWGAEDKIVSAAHAAEIKRFIPHASVTLFPGVGHIPFAEKLDETTAAVADFVMRNN